MFFFFALFVEVVMMKRLERNMMENAVKTKEKKDSAESLVWKALGNKYALAAAALLAGCAPAAARTQPTARAMSQGIEDIITQDEVRSRQTRPAQVKPPVAPSYDPDDEEDAYAIFLRNGGTYAVTSLPDSITSQRVAGGGQGGNGQTVRFSAQPLVQSFNFVGSITEFEERFGPQPVSFEWYILQEVRRSEHMLLNPRYREQGQPRYIGMVVRGVNVYDGVIGDCIVRVSENAGNPSSSPAYTPLVGSNGDVSPENLIIPLEAGSLIATPPGNGPRGGYAFTTKEPRLSVDEFGPATPLLVVHFNGK